MRCGSPIPGGSTLMTSAPKSESTVVAPGPARKLARSTTFKPEKILLVVIALLYHRPRNFGARFSRNAAVPSFLSSVDVQIATRDDSKRRPSDRLVSKPLFTASSANLQNRGAFAAILVRISFSGTHL